MDLRGNSAEGFVRECGWWDVLQLRRACHDIIAAGAVMSWCPHFTLPSLKIITLVLTNSRITARCTIVYFDIRSCRK